MTIISIRHAISDDAPLLRSLAQQCAPLDVHTPYTYWVLCKMFGNGCFVAVDGDTPIGFITSVKNDSRVLLWQMGLLEEYRGRGLSELLIDIVVQWARSENLTTVETSVDPKNASSLASFNSYSRKHSILFAKIDTVDLIDLHDASFREFEELYLLNLANFTD